ncbi:hypothetical protein [Lapillicoccus sp.]|uniref:hypothetical protein n=1 Tax=Lapillicoccus sp. TaxID=1909287 RepID=UPI003982E365
MDAKDLPDLDHVEETIAAAREAKDKLLDVDPHAINPTEDETAPTDNDTDADTGVAEASDGPRTASDDPD